ncbi:DNA alkylation repair protein, partial [Phascolarctobacterium sp.]|uniref:DNA alkylation repair protein n=1 Tax=Phascolarctobacterium sp. TaxID=2049039 RepID=UPI002A839D58
FFQELPHKYFDENQLHAFLINELKDYDQCVQELERFLPFVDNWATCDQLSPKVLKKQPEATLESIKKWMGSEHAYTIRFGMEMLMSFYLDAWFKPEFLAWVAADRNEEYYVKMMVAWFFATALAKQYAATIPYFEQRLLPAWSHKKALQKACESYRIMPEQKEYLRTLK